MALYLPNIMSQKSNLQLSKADHIRVRRSLYYHHGIYCGHGEVIHYFVSNGSGVVVRHSLSNFARGGEIEVLKYSIFPPEKVIKRAESRLREKRYNLLFNNCEHFAYWCKAGESKSPQIEIAFNIVNTAMSPISIIEIAEGIYVYYAGEKEKARNPQHLPKDILILFQRFKRAYEHKNIQELKDSISRNFSGDIYGKNRTEFINLLNINFSHLNYGISPHLVIEVLNICHSSNSEFSAVINMKANLQFLGIVTPGEWDARKLYFEAKEERDFKYWRITRIAEFKE